MDPTFNPSGKGAKIFAPDDAIVDLEPVRPSMECAVKLLNRYIPIAAVALATMVLATTPAKAAEIAFESLSTRTAFNLARDAQQPIGYITTLQIGGTNLASDLNVVEPTGGATVGVAGVLSSVRWPGGQGDPITFTAQISTRNKQLVANLLRKSLSNTSVVFDIVVYGYDPLARKYFPSFMRSTFFTATTPLQAVLAKNGGDIAIAIGEMSTEVQSPENWALTMAVLPQPIMQPLHFATSSQQKVVKRWGVAVAGNK